MKEAGIIDAEILLERYEVGEVLGQGGQGRLFQGWDRETQAAVAIKELDLHSALDWKGVELFEREGETLRSLDHPGIPDYVDAFHIQDEEGKERFFLVQEYIEGESLDRRLKRGEVMSEEEARRMAAGILDILEYLEGLNPPVVHRDLKPSNIIRRESGDYALVDFGAVQVVLAGRSGGSTMVGTSGYMPPEQLMGRAVPASDLYGLGATILAMMTGEDPADLLDENLRLSPPETLVLSPSFQKFMESLLEPILEERVGSVRKARDLLRGVVYIVGSSNSEKEHTHRPLDVGGGESRGDGKIVGAVVLMGMLVCPFCFCLLGAQSDAFSLVVTVVLGMAMLGLGAFVAKEMKARK